MALAQCIYVVILVTLLVVVRRVLSIGSRQRGLPPGPRTIPLLGNAHLMPVSFPHKTFTEWARHFGGLYSLKIANGTIIVLSNMSTVKDLIDKSSAASSDRPKNYGLELVSGSLLPVVLANYDTAAWRLPRKAIQAVLNTQSVTTYLPIIQAECAQLMYDLLHTPEEFYSHIPRFTFSNIISITFGKRCPRYETTEAKTFFDMIQRFSTLFRPGALPPVDFLPFLKYIPERWATWKTDCKELGETQHRLFFELLEECDESLARGRGNGSFIAEVLQSQSTFGGMSRQMIAQTGGTILEGGSDTITSVLHSFILCLISFPDCLRKAQEEMDSVVGSERGPCLEDAERLPYLNALIKEVYRFRPPAPFALPHAMSSTQTCQGYVIPRGATVIINVWGILHDPDFFENPDDFIPERYLSAEHGTKRGVDDRDFRANIAFGGGRRICPGIHLANAEIITVAMNLIWGFDFAPANNKDGGTSEPVDVKYRDGIVFSPQPFACQITPRSMTKAQMIEERFVEATETFVRYEDFLKEEDREYVKQSRKVFMPGS